MSYLVKVRQPGQDQMITLLRVGSKESAEACADAVRTKTTKGRYQFPIYEHVEVVEDRGE